MVSFQVLCPRKSKRPGWSGRMETGTRARVGRTVRQMGNRMSLKKKQKTNYIQKLVVTVSKLNKHYRVYHPAVWKWQSRVLVAGSGSSLGRQTRTIWLAWSPDIWLSGCRKDICGPSIWWRGLRTLQQPVLPFLKTALTARSSWLQTP